MPSKLTYNQKEYRIAQEFKKKEYELSKRIEIKYQGRIDKEKEKQKKEFERKKKQLDKKKADKLHNLKLAYGKLKGNAKERKSKPKNTQYSDACWLYQFYGRLLNTNEYGEGYCICCPDLWLKWRQGQGGHYIPKGVCRGLALVIDNISFQQGSCNLKPGGNQALQRPQMIEKVGLARVEELERLSAGVVYCKSEIAIREVLPLVREALDKKVKLLSEEGRCMKNSYYKTLAIMEGKYLAGS